MIRGHDALDSADPTGYIPGMSKPFRLADLPHFQSLFPVRGLEAQAGGTDQGDDQDDGEDDVEGGERHLSKTR